MPVPSVPSGPPAPSPRTPTRRARTHAATRIEILAAARALLIAGGTSEVTLRAIAGSLGMTAPAIYRYFDSREQLLGMLIEQLYDELGDVLVLARDGNPSATGKQRFTATAFAFRRWALTHRAEFGLLFGAPIPGVGAGRDRAPAPGANDDIELNLGARFGAVWLGLFTDLWRANPVDVPEDAAIDPELRDQLRDYRRRIGAVVPLGAIVVYLSCWMRLYGAVATEAFGHLDFALRDGNAEALFAELMQDLSARLGLAGS